MTGALRSAWRFIAADVWTPLSERDDSPDDLFIDLFVEAESHFRSRIPRETLDQVRNDQHLAAQSFLAIQGDDFVSESRIVRFLEDAHQIIADYGEPGLEREFNRLLRGFFTKYNLRYRLDDPFAIRVLYPGTFSNLYAELHRISAPNPHLGGLLADFEHAFDAYSRTQNDTNLKTCIGKASMYAEGLAGATCAKSGTLGELCKELKDWPHGAMEKAISSLYGFCSDYPGIRHAGNPAGVKRELASRDLTLACLLLLGFSGHLSPAISEVAVLGTQ